MNFWFILMLALTLLFNTISQDEFPLRMNKNRQGENTSDSNCETKSVQAQDTISITTTKDYKIFKIVPRYSEDARNKKIEGTVDLTFIITPEGEVINPKILSSNPEGYFEQEVIRVVQLWRFKAMTENVKGRTIELKQRISFKLE